METSATLNASSSSITERTRDIINRAMAAALDNDQGGQVVQRATEPTVGTVVKTPQEIPVSVNIVQDQLPDVSGIKLIMRPELGKIGFLGTSDVLPDNNWEDDNIKLRSGIKLKRLSIDDLSVMGQEFLESMKTGVSERTAGQLILIAWNLRSIIRGRHVFPENDPASTIGDTHISTLSNLVVYDGGSDTYVRDVTLTNEEFCKGVCFLTASMLRLLSKTPDNYVLAYKSHIKEAYYKFYKERFPLMSYEPHKGCIEGIHSLFSNVILYRNGIGSFLYMHNDLTNDKRMCQMLFEQHLDLTGMHIVSLFTQSCAALKTSWEIMKSALWHRTTKDALIDLLAILEKYALNADKDPKIKRRTWKYARLYDHKYFLNLQTKNCKELVCVLANVCILSGVPGQQNVLEIANVRSMSEEAKGRCKSWAEKIYAHLSTSSQGTTSQLHLLSTPST